jgi:hypothetical protein
MVHLQEIRAGLPFMEPQMNADHDKIRVYLCSSVVSYFGCGVAAPVFSPSFLRVFRVICGQQKCPQATQAWFYHTAKNAIAKL